MTFLGYFFLQGQRESQMTKLSRTQALQNNLFKNSDFGGIYQLSVDNYHTSAVAKCIPFKQSSFIMLKFQRNRTKPELITIFFLSPHFTA